jgi:hypothetical protein
LVRIGDQLAFGGCHQPPSYPVIYSVFEQPANEQFIELRQRIGANDSTRRPLHLNKCHFGPSYEDGELQVDFLR